MKNVKILTMVTAIVVTFAAISWLAWRENNWIRNHSVAACARWISEYPDRVWHHDGALYMCERVGTYKDGVVPE